MDVQEISSTANVFIRAEVSARIAGGYENVTTGTASMSFKPVGTGEPAPADYGAATWEAGGPPYYMRRLSGNLADGDYEIWVRVLLGSEDVREKVGILRVT